MEDSLQICCEEQVRAVKWAATSPLTRPDAIYAAGNEIGCEFILASTINLVLYIYLY